MVRNKKLLRRLAVYMGMCGLSVTLLATVPVFAETPMQQKPARLDGNRRRVCERREEKIKQLIRRSTDQAQDHLAVFDRISQRVQNFYKTKNLSVSNYTQLTSDVTAKRSAALMAINTTRATAFSCAGDDPKALGQIVKSNIQSMRSALKDYRASLKNLIAAVHTASTGK